MTPSILACVAGLAVSLYGEGSGNKPARAAGKLVASASFLSLAFVLGVPGLSPHGPWVLAALVLSAVGDAALLSDEKRWFLAGLVAFLLAHVAYVGAFLTLGPDPVGTGVGVALVGVLAVGIWRWLGPHTGSMKVPVLAYMTVISAMVALATGLAAAGGPASSWLLVAAVLFFTSDLFVARQRFVATTPVNRYVGLPLYFGAQLLFAWAASFAA